MTAIGVRAVGLRAAGVDDWDAAERLLSGRATCIDARSPRSAANTLPATERRRANATSRLALESAIDAVRGLEPSVLARIATVFASADGDGEVLATVLRDVSHAPTHLSPTTFHNSVFNAPAGYWSLATRATAPSTTICAGEATFAVGLLEASAQAAPGACVLLVAFDHAFPPDAPIHGAARAPFACALLLERITAGSIHRCTLDGWRVEKGSGQAWPANFEPFEGNPAACSLPLLAAIAQRRSGAVALEYGEGRCLIVEVACV